MKISKLSITNFRLLDDVEINIENDITLIVGKNNSGKTSLFEVINLFFNDKNRISFHDFSLNTHEAFNDCYTKYTDELLEANEDDQEEIENSLIEEIPRITLNVQIEYDKLKDSLINISEFISDLDENRSDATLLFKYEPKDTIGIFKSFDKRPKKEVKLIEWLNENISSHYAIRVFGGENLIDDNVFSKIQSIINFETIQASRKLDDTKMDNNRSLALGFSDYYKTVNSDNNNDVEELKITLAGTSKDLDGKYKKVLDTILTKLSSFGVDNDINIPEIILKSKFDPETIIKNNIKYFYKSGTIELPENYNGLGYSNLIYLVLKIVSFIEDFKKKKANNTTQILTILIEEPEADLHPQMQQVFIEQIRATIANALAQDKIQVQVMISTHSSHMVAEAGLNINRSFERIRYFSKYRNEDKTIVEVKDFNEFKHKETDKDTFRFLKQYLNLNKCDLFFADKVIMVEGITEKLLMPLFIKKAASKLENEYVSIIEVGGAYTHKFKEFFKFLNTKVLIVTDIDSVNGDDGKSCHVLKPNAKTSNSTLSTWLPNKQRIDDLLSLRFDEKLDASKIIRVAYQVAEDDDQFVARSLENAIINCNKDFFNSKYNYLDDAHIEQERNVHSCFSYKKLQNIEELIYMDTDKDQSLVDPSSKQKTDFTFDLMTFDEVTSRLTWKVPKYIREGLVWLANNNHLQTEITE